MDVSLRVRLENQVSKDAKVATRDLKKLGDAAQKVGSRSGSKLEKDLADIGRNSRKAKGDVKALGDQAKKLNDIKTDRSRDQIRKLRDAATRMDGPAGRLHAPLSRLAGVAASAFAGLFAFASLDGAIRALSRFKDEAFAIEETVARLGVTLERYDPAFRQQVQAKNAQLAIRYGVKQGDINQAREVLARGGMDAATSEGVIEPVMRTAKATGSSPDAWAEAAMALINQLGVTVEELPKAFDMMVKGDKLGAFSAEDMARNFPQIAAVTKSTGREGLDAVAEMVAQAQIIRRGFGSSSEAATAQREILNKLFSPEVIKNFAENGMKMESLNKKATAENRPLVDVVIEAIEKKGLGDKFDLAGLVQDTNARAALEALKMNGDLYKDMLGQISGASGVVDKDLQTVQELPIEKERRREAARNEGWRKLGGAWGGLSAPFADFFSRMLSDEYDKVRTNEERDDQIKTYQRRIDEARATKGQIEDNPSDYPGADFQIADLKAEISRLETAISALKSQSGASLGQSLGPAAEKSMQDYKKKISIEGDAAIGIAKDKAAQLKAAFSFTATPTISPRFGGSAGSQAAAQPAGLSLTQHISGTGNPERVAAAASRRQDRAIRTARAGALHDMGSLA